MRTWSRRRLLGAGAGLVAASALPRRARASVSGRDLRFVFLVAQGGWDPTRVFAPLFDNGNIDMEPDAELATQGALRWVDHADRPSVTRFFQGWGGRSVILNGLVVPSLSHDICMQRMLTGSTRSTAGDWPVLLAAAASDRYPLPHVVLEGPSFGGTLGGMVTRIGTADTVRRLLDGSILQEADGVSLAPEATTLDRADALVAELAADRRQASGWTRQRVLYERYETSLQRSRSLRDLADQVSWASDNSLSSQVSVALDFLRLDASRCITIAYDTSLWDSHADNDWKQSACFEALFSGLIELVEGLEATPASDGGTLAERTVVCMLSEMGRTPQLNNGQGKDHWSHTSLLLCGPGLDGGRVIGDYDELFYGVDVDHASAEVSSSGQQLDPGSLGATLLRLGDVDPGEALPEQAALEGILLG